MQTLGEGEGSHRTIAALVNVKSLILNFSWLWSIDSCQIKVSADQYHMTILRAEV